MSVALCFDDGIVSIGGKELPGLVTQITVAGEVRWDNAKIDGQSGKKKTPLGYEDATINIDIELLTDDDDTPTPLNCYEKLKIINRMYRDVGQSSAAPKVLSVTNQHLRARDINQVVFSGLSSRETNQDDIIIAALTFAEHNPPITTIEKRVIGKTMNAQQQAKNAPGAKPAEKVLKIDTN